MAPRGWVIAPHQLEILLFGLSALVSNVPATMLLLPSATHPLVGPVIALRAYWRATFHRRIDRQHGRGEQSATARSRDRFPDSCANGSPGHALHPRDRCDLAGDPSPVVKRACLRLIDRFKDPLARAPRSAGGSSPDSSRPLPLATMIRFRDTIRLSVEDRRRALSAV